MDPPCRTSSCDEIAAIEGYRGSVEVPSEYRLPNSCGVLAFWTWR